MTMLLLSGLKTYSEVNYPDFNLSYKTSERRNELVFSSLLRRVLKHRKTYLNQAILLNKIDFNLAKEGLSKAITRFNIDLNNFKNNPKNFGNKVRFHISLINLVSILTTFDSFFKLPLSYLENNNEIEITLKNPLKTSIYYNSLEKKALELSKKDWAYLLSGLSYLENFDFKNKKDLELLIVYLLAIEQKINTEKFYN